MTRIMEFVYCSLMESSITHTTMFSYIADLGELFSAVLLSEF